MIDIQDIKTVQKPIKIGKFTILVEKIKTIYRTRSSIMYHTVLTKDNKYINKNGEEVYWATEGWYWYFDKYNTRVTMKDIEENWRIELENKGWI